MDDRIVLWHKPKAKKVVMIAGWRQWADAGSISSELPGYIIEKTGAQLIGQIDARDCYLFQLPGTHHFLRPQIKLVDGYRSEMETRHNQIFYTGDDDQGLAIFLGDEPHLNGELYADLFFSAVEELGVTRVAAVGGVYGPVPYDKDREVSCVYSLPEMKEELTQYAVRFSNYEGGATIGTYLAHRAEGRDLAFTALYAFVPAYDFTELSDNLRGMQIETDYKAWYDILRRLVHMFGLRWDFADLQRKSAELIHAVDANIEGLEQQFTRPQVRDYLAKLAQDFAEQPFAPLSDVWEQGLEDILDDLDV
jgi:proteasome assembly chaperone (PAC2) family protein